jgi:hypothetical protein
MYLLDWYRLYSEMFIASNILRMYSTLYTRQVIQILKYRRVYFTKVIFPYAILILTPSPPIFLQPWKK